MVPFKLVMYMCHLEMVEAVITQVKPILMKIYPVNVLGVKVL